MDYFRNYWIEGSDGNLLLTVLCSDRRHNIVTNGVFDILDFRLFRLSVGVDIDGNVGGERWVRLELWEVYIGILDLVCVVNILLEHLKVLLEVYTCILFVFDLFSWL